MPRRSTASLAITPKTTTTFNGDLEPPSTLSKSEAALFRYTVRMAGPKHFRSTDAVLLARYCEAASLAEKSAQHLRDEGAVIEGRASAWLIVQEKATRALVALSGRLRLSPQGRTDPKVIARNAPGPQPWYVDQTQE